MSVSTVAVQRDQATWLSWLADFVELSKPRISLLVLVCVAVAYNVSRWGQPQPVVLLHVLLGTLFVAASASAINQWWERTTDALMPRTENRPLPAGRLGARETLLFAAATFLAGEAYLFFAISWEPAAWAFLTWATYVWIYTPLKRVTWLNTAVGAVAGALPVLIGWSAGGPIDLRAGSLFLLLFLWQFPHFMAIAWLYRREYERAGLKMLPVVDRQGRRAGRQAAIAALALIPVSLIPAIQVPGWGVLVYAAAAVTLGAGQLFCALSFRRELHERSARRLLRASLVYLPAVLLLILLVPWI